VGRQTSVALSSSISGKSNRFPTRRSQRIFVRWRTDARFHSLPSKMSVALGFEIADAAIDWSRCLPLPS
jgi:hypothetical protein